MSQLPLSVELIPLIFSHLKQEKHVLHSLLTVNKSFFKAAATILYKNPFCSSFWCNQSESSKREVLYLLLASANLLHTLTKSTTKILDWVITNWEPPTAPFTVNYLNYYTEINYSEWEGISKDSSPHAVSDSSIIHLLFCRYNAEKIKSICLPILNMTPYLPIASRMSSLRRIEFCRVPGDAICGTNDQNIVTIKEAILFVKIHVDTFNSTLTEIKIPNFTDLERIGIRLDVRSEDIVKVLKRPQVIDVYNSYNFCQYIHGSTVDRLRVFGGPRIVRAGVTQDWDSASLFQCCHKLEQVRFSPTRPDSFTWAVERRDSERALPTNVPSTSYHKLAPLQNVDMMCKLCPALPIVQDIVYAFRDTIKNIVVMANQHAGFEPDPLCWDWLLPNLVKIKISEADLSLFDFGSLNLCPSLEELYLTDKYVYRSIGAVTEFAPTLKLPNLRKIRLDFGISSKFNFASLHHSPLLESLVLHETGSALPIRPTNSPCWSWSWDWNLPHLKELYLAGEAAVLFQFRLLDSCPPLERLRLSIEGYHRSLAVDEIPRTDLLLPSESMDQERSKNIYVCKPLFSLNGQWELSRETLSALLQRYMSHVMEIQLTDTKGFTGRDVIDVTQKLANIQYVYSTLCLTDPDIEKSGIQMKASSQSGTGWRCTGTAGSVTYNMAHTRN